MSVKFFVLFLFSVNKLVIWTVFMPCNGGIFLIYMKKMAKDE